jgi:hypothetical protein
MSLQAAIDALPASGGKIFVKAGTYPSTETIHIHQGNTHNQGEGMGITVFVADASMIGNTPGLEAFSTVLDGTPRTLVGDTIRGGMSIQVSATDAGTFNSGDFVLLYSNKSVDTEAPAKHAGELKQIVAVDATSGVLTTDDQITDACLLSDLAAVVRTTMLRSITLADFSITTEAAQSNLRVGFTHFWFAENLQIERIEVHDAYFTGIPDPVGAEVRDLWPLYPPYQRYRPGRSVESCQRALRDSDRRRVAEREYQRLPVLTYPPRGDDGWQQRNQCQRRAA